MVYKKIQKYILSSLLFGVVMGVASAQDLVVHEIVQKYKPIIDTFVQINSQKDQDQALLAPPLLASQLFLQINMPSGQILKNLHKDLRLLIKEIKKIKKQKSMTNASQLDVAQALRAQITDLIKYLRKYQLLYDVTMAHQAMYARWSMLFEAVACGQDIEPLLEVPGVDGLKILIKRTGKDLRKIDEYEYRLHSDWIDAKLANYVLKIELIRLRNAAIFHPLSKGTTLQLPSSYPR